MLKLLKHNLVLGAFARSRCYGKVIPFPEPRDRAKVLETRLAKTVFDSTLHETKP